MSEQLGILFLVLFLVAVTVSIYLAITMSRRVQAGINRWCNEEKQALEAQLKQWAEDSAHAQLEQWKRQNEDEIRRDAIRRSSAITKGKVTEHIVPYLPGFDLDPKDLRFLGTPIDLIAFKGLCDDSVEEIEIVFIEVKTGKSALSARERAVKKAVEKKKVSWRVFNPDDETLADKSLPGIQPPKPQQPKPERKKRSIWGSFIAGWKSSRSLAHRVAN
jgi:predicted Holliday junction resolvase-like endonuclease